MILKFNEITFKDKEKIQAYLGKNHTHLGWEYNFAMTYIWNAFEETKVAYLEDIAFVFTKFYGKCVFYPPYIKDNSLFVKAVEIIRNHCLECGCKMEIAGLNKEHVELLDTNIYEISTNRNDSDYIYLTKDLIELIGKKFHSKRNFISRFKSKYNYIFREYEDSDFQNVMALYDNWNQKSVHETLDLERDVIERALTCKNDLDLKVGILEVDGNIVAFSASAIENSNVVHVFFEKGDMNFAGVYQMINQLTAETFFKDCIYANRQEDMGIEGLRKSKNSYNPVMLLDKYVVHLKK